MPMAPSKIATRSFEQAQVLRHDLDSLFSTIVSGRDYTRGARIGKCAGLALFEDPNAPQARSKRGPGVNPLWMRSVAAKRPCMKRPLGTGLRDEWRRRPIINSVSNWPVPAT